MKNGMNIATIAISMVLFACAGHAGAQDRSVPDTVQQVRYSYAPLVKQVSPAVVNVYAARTVARRPSPFAGDPFFERFFGQRGNNRQQQRTARSLGSGVIVGSEGIIVTNVHVIAGADEIRIALKDGQEFEAEVLLSDAKSDLAVLKVDAGSALPTVQLGDSEALEVGDLVLALGNPFGVGQTVTSGIVSALARSQAGVQDFGFYVQTDASINPGNSGGALVDMGGNLVGINTAIFSRSGGSNGIGFAVPSNMVRVVIDSALAGSSTLIRPWIGATFQAVSSDIALSLGMARPLGALVADVDEDGPAATAGLATGDVVIAFDGKPLQHMDALGYRLATAGLNQTVELTLISRGKEKVIPVELVAAPEDPARDARTFDGPSPFSGMEVANLSPRVAQELGLPTSKRGVVITKVEPGTAAARFGFRPKDILLTIRQDPMLSTRLMASIVRTGGRAWPYTVERDGRTYHQFIR